jgi:hypothetical protein
VATSQWQNPVSGSEARVHATVDQFDAKRIRKPTARAVEPFRACGVRDVVQTHARILAATA